MSSCEGGIICFRIRGFKTWHRKTWRKFRNSGEKTEGPGETGRAQRKGRERSGRGEEQTIIHFENGQRGRRLLM